MPRDRRGSSRRKRAALSYRIARFCARVRNGASSIASIERPIASGQII
jgi:hypothetical protein